MLKIFCAGFVCVCFEDKMLTNEMRDDDDETKNNGSGKAIFCD